MTQEKIDIVVLWVDGSAPEFIREKQAVTENVSDLNQEIDGEQRDYGIFNYWFRMIEKNAPWVNNVYLITNGQKPDWLNLEHPKLKLVTHREFMPKEYLPTYNSAAIELNLHRIEGLSENYLYFNDDMYLIRDSQPSDFYKNGQPKLLAVYDALVPWSPFTNTYHNNVELIYRHFPNKKALKSSPWKFFGVDVNQYICQHWQIESNQFYPMSKSFGETIGLNQVDKLESIFKDRRKKLLCVNDDVDFKEENIIRFKEILNEYYPEKSAFEK